MIGKDITKTPIIESFSAENEKIIIDSNNNWKSKMIIENRISYFKKMGINLGDNYQNYSNNKLCQTIWPKQEVIDCILETKKKYTDMFQQEYYNSIPRYKTIQEKIDSLNLINENISCVNIFENSSIAGSVCPNIKKDDDGPYKEQHLMFIKSKLHDEYLDKNIIHEFNHLLELSPLTISEQGGTFLCGWDIIQLNTKKDDSNKTNAEEKSKRNYELFNEIINETIAQEISSMMHQQGIYLFNTKENCKDFGGTGYQKSYSIVKEFIETYKSLIIESRRNGNIKIIFDNIGKENFESLNNLVNRFNQIFSEFEYYNLIDDIRNNKDTERTRAYAQILQEKDEIMNQMKMYSNSKTI